MLNRSLLGGLTGTQIPIKSCCPSQMPLCCPTSCPVVILCFITALTLLYRAKGNVIYPIPSWNRKNKHLLSVWIISLLSALIVFVSGLRG